MDISRYADTNYIPPSREMPLFDAPVSQVLMIWETDYSYKVHIIRIWIKLLIA